MRHQELEYISAKRDNNGNLVRQRQPQPTVRTPQFPGVSPGMSIDAVRDVIRHQKRCRGYQFNLSAGAENTFPIDLSGTARLFLGFALEATAEFDPVDIPESMTITINNEIVIQDVHPVFFGKEFMDDEYYFIPRPLSGQDDITIQFVAPNDFNVLMVAYYI